MSKKHPQRRSEEHQRAVLDRRRSSASGFHKQKKHSRLANKQYEIDASEEAFDFDEDEDDDYWSR